MNKKSRMTKNEPLSDAKKAIKRSIGRYRGKLKVEEDPEIAIEVLDDEIKAYRPVEQALVAEHIFRKTIEESIGVGIAGFDLDWKQIYVNRTFCKMVGWPESDLMGHAYPPPYVIQAGQRAFIEAIQQAVSLPGGVEFEFQRKNAPPFWALIYSNELTDTDGKTVGRLISVADIDNQKKSESTLRMLSTRLIDAQERERKLLSQDLHDSIGGRLAGIKYGLEKIVAKIKPSDSPVSDLVRDIIAVVRSTLEETQRITKNLHPSLMDDLGLLSAIREYCREFQHLYPQIAVDLDLRIDEADLPDTLKIMTYRVLQEAFNNIAKHSAAKNVAIALQQSPDRLELTISDDGKGFNPQSAARLSSAAGGLGLDGMRERAELFGGSFQLDSAIEEGTRIRIAWPVYPLAHP